MHGDGWDFAVSLHENNTGVGHLEKNEGLAFVFLLGSKRESAEGLKGGKKNGFSWFYFGFPL